MPFKEDLVFGNKKAEEVTDRLQKKFGVGFIKAKIEDDRRGVDYWGSNEQSYQVKCDRKAFRTGNVFVEVVSVDTKGKQGWALDCAADWILYYIIGQQKLICIDPNQVASNIKGWSAKYPTRPTNKLLNHGYRSWGVLVPIEAMEQVADLVVEI